MKIFCVRHCVSLSTYSPCLRSQSVGHAYNGHSSHVTTVQFMRDDDRVISTGGQDCSVMQWKVV